MSEALEQTLAALHRHAISEVLHLLDGFYENLEHGLFELVLRSDPDTQNRCASMMKELRLQKARKLRKFAQLMESDQALWTSDAERGATGETEPLHETALSLAQKRVNHFDAVLGSVTRCVAAATGRSESDIDMPIGPVNLAYNFLRCFEEAQDDPELSPMLRELFARLVLDRLGPLYGEVYSRIGHSENQYVEYSDGLVELSHQVA